MELKSKYLKGKGYLSLFVLLCTVVGFMVLSTFILRMVVIVLSTKLFWGILIVWLVIKVSNLEADKKHR